MEADRNSDTMGVGGGSSPSPPENDQVRRESTDPEDDNGTGHQERRMQRRRRDLVENGNWRGGTRDWASRSNSRDRYRNRDNPEGNWRRVDDAHRRRPSAGRYDNERSMEMREQSRNRYDNNRDNFNHGYQSRHGTFHDESNDDVQFLGSFPRNKSYNFKRHSNNNWHPQHNRNRPPWQGQTERQHYGMQHSTTGQGPPFYNPRHQNGYNHNRTPHWLSNGKYSKPYHDTTPNFNFRENARSSYVPNVAHHDNQRTPYYWKNDPQRRRTESGYESHAETSHANTNETEQRPVRRAPPMNTNENRSRSNNSSQAARSSSPRLTRWDDSVDRRTLKSKHEDRHHRHSDGKRKSSREKKRSPRREEKHPKKKKETSWESDSDESDSDVEEGEIIIRDYGHSLQQVKQEARSPIKEENLFHFQVSPCDDGKCYDSDNNELIFNEGFQHSETPIYQNDDESSEEVSEFTVNQSEENSEEMPGPSSRRTSPMEAEINQSSSKQQNNPGWEAVCSRTNNNNSSTSDSNKVLTYGEWNLLKLKKSQMTTESGNSISMYGNSLRTPGAEAPFCPSLSTPTPSTSSSMQHNSFSDKSFWTHVTPKDPRSPYFSNQNDHRITTPDIKNQQRGTNIQGHDDFQGPSYHNNGGIYQHHGAGHSNFNHPHPGPVRNRAPPSAALGVAPPIPEIPVERITQVPAPYVHKGFPLPERGFVDIPELYKSLKPRRFPHLGISLEVAKRDYEMAYRVYGLESINEILEVDEVGYRKQMWRYLSPETREAILSSDRHIERLRQNKIQYRNETMRLIQSVKQPRMSMQLPRL